MNFVNKKCNKQNFFTTFMQTVFCPPNCEERSIWGTQNYTDDSSVCTAAAHEGLTTLTPFLECQKL